jgi:nucleoside-diphosphate-sugar epimerase
LKYNLLITGITGDIGSATCKYFRQKNFNIYGISRKNHKNIDNVININHDLSKSQLHLLNIDYCIHTAGISPSKKWNNKYIIENGVITNNLLKSLSNTNCKRLIFLSSISIYDGLSKCKVIDETTDITNPYGYGLSKYISEKIIEDNIFTYTILRIPGIIIKNKKKIWLEKTIDLATQSKNIEIYNHDDYFNNVLSISDLLNFIELQLMDRSSSNYTFTLGASKMIKIHDMAKYIVDITNSKSIIHIKESKNNNPHIKSANAIRNGFKPTGVLDTIKYYINL